MKGSICVARVLCLLLLAGSPALAFPGAGFGGGMHAGGFGGGMQFGGGRFGSGRFGTASGFHGGFGPTFRGPWWAVGPASRLDCWSIGRGSGPALVGTALAACSALGGGGPRSRASGWLARAVDGARPSALASWLRTGCDDGCIQPSL